MKNTTVLGLSVLLLSLAAPACEFVHSSFEYDGVSYSDRNGVLYIDDVPLRFERWVRMEHAIPAAGRVSIGSSSGAITLTGAASAETAVLEVHVFSEVENDGVVSLERGKVSVRSTGDHKVAINGARGTVPADVNLDVDTGTADVMLDGLSGGATLKVNSGTGDVKLDACQVASITMETGTGDMTLTDVKATTISSKSGTGSTRLKACSADDLKWESGTGDLRVDGSQFHKSRLDSGTGDVRVLGASSLGAESHDLGTGDIRVSPGSGG